MPAHVPVPVSHPSRVSMPLRCCDRQCISRPITLQHSSRKSSRSLRYDYDVIVIYTSVRMRKRYKHKTHADDMTMSSVIDIQSSWGLRSWFRANKLHKTMTISSIYAVHVVGLTRDYIVMHPLHWLPYRNRRLILCQMQAPSCAESKSLCHIKYI